MFSKSKKQTVKSSKQIVTTCWTGYACICAMCSFRWVMLCVDGGCWVVIWLWFGCAVRCAVSWLLFVLLWLCFALIVLCVVLCALRCGFGLVVICLYFGCNFLVVFCVGCVLCWLWFALRFVLCALVWLCFAMCFGSLLRWLFFGCVLCFACAWLVSALWWSWLFGRFFLCALVWLCFALLFGLLVRWLFFGCVLCFA